MERSGYIRTLSHNELRSAAVLCGSAALLIAVGAFLSGAAPLQGPASNAALQTAATALGDTQGVPPDYTGQQYPDYTHCHINGSYWSYGPESLPMCLHTGYGNPSTGQEYTFYSGVFSVNQTGSTAGQSKYVTSTYVPTGFVQGPLLGPPFSTLGCPDGTTMTATASDENGNTTSGDCYSGGNGPASDKGGFMGGGSTYVGPATYCYVDSSGGGGGFMAGGGGGGGGSSPKYSFPSGYSIQNGDKLDTYGGASDTGAWGSKGGDGQCRAWKYTQQHVDSVVSSAGIAPTVPGGSSLTMQWSCLPNRDVYMEYKTGMSWYSSGYWAYYLIYNLNPLTSSVQGGGPGFSPPSSAIAGSNTCTVTNPNPGPGVPGTGNGTSNSCVTYQSATVTAPATAGTYNYSLTCNSSWGLPAMTVPVTVTGSNASVTLTANPTSVFAGHPSALTWSATNASSCTLSGGQWGGAGQTVAASSTNVSTGNLGTNTTYSINCPSSSGGAAGTASATVTVLPANQQATVSITANPSTVGTGARTTATWSSTNVQSGSCTEYVAYGAGQSTSFAATQGGSQQTPPLTQSGWLEIDCKDLTGAWAIATAPFTVSGSNQPPTVSVSASPVYVRLGSASTISWSSQNASSCSVSGPSFSASGLSGSQSTGALSTAGDYTYTATCHSSFGFPDATGSAVVHAVDLPAISFTATPSSVLPGGLSTLSWTCPNPPYTSSTGDTHYSTGGAVSGSAGINPLQTTTYSVTCNAAGGLYTNGSAQVSVLNPTLTITATPNKVKKGKTTTINWSATNITAGSCRVTGTDGSSWSGASGSQSPTINAPTTFTLACSVPSGPLSQSVTVGLIPGFQEI